VRVLKTCSLGALLGLLLIASACSLGGSSNPPSKSPPGPPAVRLDHVDLPPLAGRTASFEQLEIDQESHVLYAADRTDRGLDVFDVSSATARYLRTIPLSQEPYSIALDPARQRLFTGLDGSSVAIVDLKPGSKTQNTVVGTINTGGTRSVGWLALDAPDNKLYAVNDEEGFISVVDGVKKAVVKRIDGRGTLGAASFDAAAKTLRLAGYSANSVITINTATDAIASEHKLGTACSPIAVLAKPGSKQALVACGAEQRMLTWDIDANKVLATSTEAGRADSAIFSQQGDRFLVAASHYKPVPEVAIYSAASLKLVARYRTTAGSHSLAYDESNRVVYLPDQLQKAAGLLSFRVSGG
jgi:DNA-binding beta-propeller fold protein YncE